MLKVVYRVRVFVFLSSPYVNFILVGIKYNHPICIRFNCFNISNFFNLLLVFQIFGINAFHYWKIIYWI